MFSQVGSVANLDFMLDIRVSQPAVSDWCW